MRIEKKKVKMDCTEVSMERFGDEFCGVCKYTYTFESLEPIDMETLECFIDVKVPETISEFRELHGLSKEDLTAWLNKNYKI